MRDSGIGSYSSVTEDFEPFEIRNIDRAHLVVVSWVPPLANIVDCDEYSPRLHIVREL